MRIKGYNGFLFIGDPHLAGYRPGRRQDDYTNVILDKLEQAAMIATEQNLVPVILGDLFHKNKENSLRLLSRLIDISRRFPMVAFTLEGNHDKEETRLTNADALTLVSKLGAFTVLTKEGLAGEFDFGGRIVRLYAVPYGSEIPRELPEEEGVTNIIITHHDLNFSGAHPGCKPIQEIVGCKMLVNGHIHKKLPSFDCGAMRAHNPGNIARLSKDVIHEVPSVWEWRPDFNNFELKRHILTYNSGVFDLTGDNVAPAAGKASVKALDKSAFAELFVGETRMEGARSDDASGFKQDMDEVFEDKHVSEATRTLLNKIRREAVKALKGAPEVQ
jgi:predicted phosphodiesterase